VPVERTDRLLLAALLLLNLALKCSWLGVNVLFNDEPFTVYWSQQPWSALWPMLAAENNPPLYFLLIKVWSWITPFEAAWLRVPAAVFSALVVWPLYLLAQRLSGRRTAILAALIFTFTNYHYGYAHEVRAYALFTLLTVTSLWLLVRAKDLPANGLRALIGLSALNTLLVYTHFFGWLAVGLEFLLVFTLPELRHLRRNFALGMGITLLYFAPYLRLFLHRMGQSVGQGTWLEPPVAEELYNMLWRWSNQPVLVVFFLALLIAGGLKDRFRSFGSRFAWLWALVPLGGMFLVSFVVPMFLDRYLVFAAPGFALAVAISADALLPKHRIGHLLASIPVLGMLITFTPWESNERQPVHLAEQVRAWCTEGCELMVVPAWYWLNYLAVKDLDQLQADQRERLSGAASMHQPNGTGPVVVVDASGDLADLDRSWRWELARTLPMVDSTQADHKVWVYRFSR
jgi:mannosyltransferase